jgi:hypothetical protein
MMSASEISKAIREKKKKLLEGEPEMIGTSPVPDMNAQDIWDDEKRGYIEDMTDSPHKIDARETMANAPSDHEIKMENHARMGRLRKYFDSLGI